MIIGRMYILQSMHTPYIYIGSTMKTIAKRLKQHQQDYKRYLNKKYQLCF